MIHLVSIDFPEREMIVYLTSIYTIAYFSLRDVMSARCLLYAPQLYLSALIVRAPLMSLLSSSPSQIRISMVWICRLLLMTFTLTLSIEGLVFAQQTSAGQPTSAASASPERAPDAPPRALPKRTRVEEEAQKRVNRLSDQLKSPFCPGKTLLNCTSYQAYALRKEMMDMILEGKDDRTILRALRDSFGEEIENPPQPWYTGLVPFMPFIFGAILAIWIFSMWIRGHDQEREVVEEIDVDDAHRDRLKALMRDDD